LAVRAAPDAVDVAVPVALEAVAAAAVLVEVASVAVLVAVASVALVALSPGVDAAAAAAVPSVALPMHRFQPLPPL
jgi:hypothetical protein